MVEPARRRARAVLGHVALAVLPLIPLVAALVVQRAPSDERVVPLSGAWQREDDGSSVTLPGRLGAIRSDVVTLRRTVTLDTKKLGDRCVVTFGGAQQLVFEILVNGHRVGAEGVPEDRYKLSALGLSLFEIEPGLLHDGDNLIEVRLRLEIAGTDAMSAILDHRLFLGPASVLRPYFDVANVLQAFFEIGGAFYLLCAMCLVLALLRVETDALDRHEQGWVALMACAVATYLAGKSGLYVVFHLTRAIIPISITFIAISVPAFLQMHLQRRLGLLNRVNLVVCGLNLLAQLLLNDMDPVYQVFVPYLFVVIVTCFVFALRCYAREFPHRSPLVIVSCACLVIAGVNDLMTDLGVLATPRLFSIAAADMAIMTTLVIAGRFLRTLRENTALLRTLEEKNVALTETTRLKSEFLANTSHELRTPLNSIINVPEGLLEEFVRHTFVVCDSCQAVFDASPTFHLDDAARCPECQAVGRLREDSRWVFSGDPEAAVRYLKSIQSSGRHLRAVVDDILDFSKLEAGKMTLHYESVAVADVLTKVELTMRPLAEQRGIDLVFGGDPVIMSTDPLKLAQVLMNLVSNAVKFSEDGKAVEVRVAQVVGQGESGRVRIDVEDRGIGIAPADLAIVFESFRQVESGHTRRFSGTGLGLPIVKHIVELMGGTVEAKSEVGRGSTFTVWLPVAPPAS